MNERIKTFPESIYMTLGEDDGEARTFEDAKKAGAEIYWVDHPISAADVNYVRADLHEKVKAQLANAAMLIKLIAAYPNARDKNIERAKEWAVKNGFTSPLRCEPDEAKGKES